ncbi:MAG: polyisoprenoid-binding protein [Bacteroidetes bacterium]|nr:polyisoprenoid-binding protein [Bacteroidota bacterium]MCW5896079.1 polyisoprenoid-binding protein [Bacteroidota bacterium]
MKHTILALLVFAAFSGQAQTKWKLDKSHSNVNFSVSHMVFSEVTGLFREFDATMVASKEDMTDAKIEATIKTSSIDTQNERRDNHLRADDFLNAEMYPEIKFVSTKVEKAGDRKYKITGNLTVRDITKPVVLDAEFRGTITDPRGNVKSAFKATTKIDRFEFGTKWNNVLDTGGLVAGKEIEVTLLLQFAKEKAQG